MYSIYDDIKYILYWYINSIFTCYFFPPFLIEPTEGLRLVIREFPPKVVSNFINGKNIKDRNIRRISSGIKTGAPHTIALRCAPLRHFYSFSLVPAGIIADFQFFSPPRIIVGGMRSVSTAIAGATNSSSQHTAPATTTCGSLLRELQVCN